MYYLRSETEWGELVDVRGKPCSPPKSKRKIEQVKKFLKLNPFLKKDPLVMVAQKK